MPTTQTAASVQQSRPRAVPHEFNKAAADLRFALGFMPSAASVAGVAEDALAHGLVPVEGRANSEAVAQAVRDGTVPPELGYLSTLTAIREAASAKALEWLDGRFLPNDVVEVSALKANGKGRVSYNGRLGVPAERAAMAAFVEKHNGRGSLYAGINPRPEAFAGTNRQAKAEDIAERRHVVFDFDNKADATGNKHAAAIEALRAHKPSAEVMSGNGTHLWFALAPGAPVQANTSALNRAMTALGADSMGDPSRIIRLPWTINVPSERKRKAGAELVLSVVVQEDATARAQRGRSHRALARR